MVTCNERCNLTSVTVSAIRQVIEEIRNHVMYVRGNPPFTLAKEYNYFR